MDKTMTRKECLSFILMVVVVLIITIGGMFIANNLL
jgi:uncharacterized protein YneF (UPF0154 family)